MKMQPAGTISCQAWYSGPIILSGNWEPLIFRRRLGGGCSDVAERYLEEHSPELVRELQRKGINLLITHYFKGFGLQAEAEDIVQTRKLTRLCHQANIRVGAYIGDTLIPETFLTEEPDAASWYQIDAAGNAIQYGGTQSFRYKWCRTNPAFLTYMKRVLAQALEDGIDLIHFDNFLEKPEPLSCHCIYCQNAFRDFLKQTMNDAERKERFGFADVSNVSIPLFSAPLYQQWNAEQISNPLLQEWIRFRCQMLSRRYQELAQFCRKKSPQVAIECNPSGIRGENTAYLRAVDHDSLLPHGNFFWDESPNQYGLLENGALCTHLRTMKLAEHFNSRVFYYSWKSELQLAEGLAFNRGCLGMAGTLQGKYLKPAQGPGAKYHRFLLAHARLFCQSKSLARVAVYRNFTSLAWNSLQPHQQAILAEETLLENHIPFDIITSLKNLPYGVLLLPGTECLDDNEIAALTMFARKGGKILLTGNAGSKDGWGRLRPRHPLQGKAFLQKNLVFLPELELSCKAPPLSERLIWDSCYRVLDARFWVLPNNAEVLLQALRELQMPLQLCSVQAPDMTLVEPRQGPEDILLLHIIHCDPKNLHSTIRLQFSHSFQRIQCLVPGRKAQRLAAKQDKEGTSLEMTLDAVYGLLALTPATTPDVRET